MSAFVTALPANQLREQLLRFSSSSAHIDLHGHVVIEHRRIKIPQRRRAVKSCAAGKVSSAATGASGTRRSLRDVQIDVPAELDEESKKLLAQLIRRQGRHETTMKIVHELYGQPQVSFSADRYRRWQGPAAVAGGYVDGLICDTHRRCARIPNTFHIEGTLESVREMCESIIAQLDMLEEDFRFEVEETSSTPNSAGLQDVFDSRLMAV